MTSQFPETSNGFREYLEEKRKINAKKWDYIERTTRAGSDERRRAFEEYNKEAFAIAKEEIEWVESQGFTMVITNNPKIKQEREKDPKISVIKPEKIHNFDYCAICGRSLWNKRLDAITCSDACRKAYQRMDDPEKNNGRKERIIFYRQLKKIMSGGVNLG